MNRPSFRLPTFCILLLALLLLAGPAFSASPIFPPAPAAETASEASPQTGPAQLAELLEDPATRQALIEQLRRNADELDTSTATPAAEAGQAPFAQRLAASTQSLAERSIQEVVATLAALGQAKQRLQEAHWGTVALQSLIFVLFDAAVLAVFWLLGRLAARLYARLDSYVLVAAAHVAALRRTLAVLTAVAIHLGAVALTWLAGQGLAQWLPQDSNLPTLATLFLNAFLLVEGIRVILATLFSDRYPGLRLVPASSEEAAYWSAWATRMLYFIGYGLMLVAPLLSQLLAFELGRALSLFILLAAFLKTTTILLQNRARTRSSLEALAERMQTTFARVTLMISARLWHLIAIAYVSALLITTVFYPDQALGFMLRATVQTLVATLLGITIATILNGIILRRIKLPDETRQRFPLLEERLNAYVPTVLKITRFIILAIVLAFVLDAWTRFDLLLWVQSEAGTHTLATLTTVLLIFGLALLIWLVTASWIEYRLHPNAGRAGPSPRVQTLLAIFRNAVAITLILLTTMVMLAELGVNIAPLLAGAGVVGLAVGFGAQKLVQDVITGLFIQLEGAIHVGDLITAAGITGTVEKLTVRSVGLRDLSGTYHLLPFSSVDVVSNFMRDHAFHLGEYHVAYREDVDEAIEHLKAAFEELRVDPEQAPYILDELEIHGISAFTERSMIVRIRIKTVPGYQFPVGRAYNRCVKRHFDAAGIQIPYPNMTLHFGTDREGQAPAANLRLDSGSLPGKGPA